MDYENSGFDKLSAHLQAIRRELTGPAQERMVRAGAKVFKRGMVERTPILKPGTEGKTSLPPMAMKQGIGITVRKKRGGAEASIGPRGKDLKFKAFDVEYGHREIVHGHQVGDVVAHPFIRPTYEADLQEAEAAMIASVDEMVKEMQDAQ